MVSLGPFPMPLIMLLLAFGVSAAVGWQVARATGLPSVKVVSIIVDMLFVGLLAARLGFIVEWLPQYLADPWSIIRVGDGGFSVWLGVLVGLAFGTWRAYKAKPLRRSIVLSATAGIATWAMLGGALTLMQQSTIRVPATELVTLDHGITSLSAMSGKPMVVNLWATWCPPCRREMPVLADAQVRRGDITFAFVNQGEPERVIRDYLRNESMQLQNVLIDLFSSVSQEAGSRGLPTTLFFDAKGQLVDTHMGELSDASLAVKLQRLGSAPSD